MGSHQLLLLVLAVVIIGIAVACGVALFGADSIHSNRDAIVNDLQRIAGDAMAFRLKSGRMGGGNGSFTGYAIPRKFQSNDDAAYTPTTPNTIASTITFVATSSAGYGTVTAVLDSTGKLGNFAYTGEF